MYPDLGQGVLMVEIMLFFLSNFFIELFIESSSPALLSAWGIREPANDSHQTRRSDPECSRCAAVHLLFYLQNQSAVCDLIDSMLIG
tara:strand:+ start:1743 stop:2003 length:261 start_codon:yes stop_codon:yes gene_type:complete